MNYHNNINEQINKWFTINSSKSESILDYSQLIKLTKKWFSLSPLWINRENLLISINSETYLFSFDFGIVVTTNEILFVRGDKKMEIINIDFSDIFKIIVDKNSSKIIYESYEIGFVKLNYDVYDIFLSFQKIFDQNISNTFNESNVELYQKIYDSVTNYDSIKFYFKNVIIENIDKKIIEEGRDKYFRNNFLGKTYFFKYGGLYFTENDIIYVYFEKLNEFEHIVCKYDESCEKIIYFLQNSIPIGIEKKLNWEDKFLNITNDFIGKCLKVRFRKFENLKIQKERDRIKLENERKQNEEVKRIELERIRIQKLETSKSLYISRLDQDNNGEIDLIDCDSFTKLLNTKQKNIIEIDKSYIQKFVKISIYIKTKKSNIQKLFQTIKSVKYENQLEELVGLLQNQVHTYNLLIFHSINMITSLTESELITFYEIYECFDKLGVFNSNWENEVSTNLLNINSSIDEVNQSIIHLDDNISRGLQNLMYSINNMENNIINSINELTYITDYSFGKLNNVIEGQLSDINSSLNFNNLLTGIQTYQMYKINQNTKRIN